MKGIESFRVSKLDDGTLTVSICGESKKGEYEKPYECAAKDLEEVFEKIKEYKGKEKQGKTKTVGKLMEAVGLDD